MKKMTKTNSVIKTLSKYSIDIESLDPKCIIEFKNKVKYLSDSRQKGKKKYKIWDIVVVTFICVLANCNDWEEIHNFARAKYSWFKSFLKLTGGIPSAKTYERVFSIINPNELEDICVLFATDVLKIFSPKVDILNIDGKVDKASSRNENELRDSIKALNVLNVYSNNLNMCVASEMIHDKTNEIPTIPVILNRLNIKDSIITWDALNTQKDNVKAVINGKGDYVVALKSNQPNFYDEVVLYFDDKRLDTIKAGNSKSAYLKTIEKSHSSSIKYEYFQTEDISWFEDLKSWKGLKSIGLVKKTILKNGKETVEKRYYISSLYLNIKLFSNAIRKHWSVENKLHWQLDFTFKQDNNTTLNKKALFNLQIIKKLALALLNKVKNIYDMSLKGLRFIISINFEQEILRFFNILAHNN